MLNVMLIFYVKVYDFLWCYNILKDEEFVLCKSNLCYLIIFGIK